MVDEGVINRIVETYSDVLLRIALHRVHSYASAQDIVQNVFLKYLQKLPTFHDDAHERAWFMRVTMNSSCDFMRHWWQKKQSELPDQIALAETTASTSLLPLLRKLSKHQCYALYLFYYENYSILQIAMFFDVKEATVASWLHRGRKKMRLLLEGRSDYET